jgi:hypothetical protein
VQNTKVTNLPEPVVLTFQHQPQPVSVSGELGGVGPCWTRSLSPLAHPQSISPVLNEKVVGLKAPARQVWVGTGTHAPPLRPPQKNVTLQCVFWVEDPTCE